jgi:hypothetical protein
MIQKKLSFQLRKESFFINFLNIAGTAYKSIATNKR